MKKGGVWSSYASGRKARVLSNAELWWRRHQFTIKLAQWEAHPCATSRS